MTTCRLTVQLPADGPAVLTLPEPLTLETLGRIERAIAESLGMLRRDLPGVTDELAATDRGVLEYDSWLRALRGARA